MGSEALSVSISQALKPTVDATVSDKSYLIECQQCGRFIYSVFFGNLTLNVLRLNIVSLARLKLRIFSV